MLSVERIASFIEDNTFEFNLSMYQTQDDIKKLNRDSKESKIVYSRCEMDSCTRRGEKGGQTFILCTVCDGAGSNA